MLFSKRLALVVAVGFCLVFTASVVAVSSAPQYASVSGVPDSTGSVNLHTGGMALNVP